MFAALKMPRVQRRKEQDDEEPDSPNSVQQSTGNGPRRSNSFGGGLHGLQASKRHAKNNAIIHNRNHGNDIDCDDRHLSFSVEYHVDWAEQAKADVIHFMMEHGITAQSHIFHVVDCYGSPYEPKCHDAEEVFPLRFVFHRKAI